jgi:hypothetical protein
MRYKEIPELSRDEIEEEFSTDDDCRKTIALLSAALYLPDREWVESKCVEFLTTPSFHLNYAAIVSLSHLVRIHRRLDLKAIQPLLEQAESRGDLAGDVQVLRDEIEIYMKRPKRKESAEGMGNGEKPNY